MSTKPFDATVKELIECDAAAWSALAGLSGVRRASAIDADVSTVTAAADKVILVEGARGPSILDVEPTSGFGGDVPGRLHLYSAILYHRHQLPVRCVALLLRREANAANLTGVLELRHPDEAEPYDVFRYQVVRLWQEPLAPLLAGGLGTLPLAALTDEAESVLPDVIRRIEQRLSIEATPDTADQLRAATGILLSLKYTQDFLENLYEGLTSMEMEDTAFARMFIVRGERRTIIRQGTKKFGPPDEATLAALNEFKDVERLEQMAERLLDVSSWQELLAAPN